MKNIQIICLLIIISYSTCENTELQEDFNSLIFEGQSILKTPLVIIQEPRKDKNPDTNTFLFITDYTGQILWYKKGRFENGKTYRNAYNEIRFTFGQAVTEIYQELLYKAVRDLVIFNDKFEEIDRIRSLSYGDIPGNFPYTHDYVYIDDGHYVLLFAFRVREKIDFIVQEQKDKEVVFHWQSNYPSGDIIMDEKDDPHPNTIAIDPKDNNFVVSCYHSGIFKLNRNTGKIMWIIGKVFNSFANMAKTQIPFAQHDIFFAKDGSLLTYDDRGYTEWKTRVVRYWLDEVNLQMINFKEYVYHQPKVINRGGIQMLDEEKEILGITYGGSDGKNVMYEEYDFENQKSFLRIKSKFGNSIFRITRLIE